MKKTNWGFLGLSCLVIVVVSYVLERPNVSDAMERGRIALTGQNKAEQETQKQVEADQIIHKRLGIRYIKDSRTGICFAVCGEYLSELSIATVPCEKIPPELLTTAK